METFTMGDNLNVKLSLSISTEALIGIHIKLKDKIIKKSTLYDLKMSLGNSDIIENNKLTIVITCFVDDNIEEIMANAIAQLTITDGINTTNDFTFLKYKVIDNMFIICFHLNLKK